jgi:hypothetical protein
MQCLCLMPVDCVLKPCLTISQKIPLQFLSSYMALVVSESFDILIPIHKTHLLYNEL